jgi:hypothetical protein
VTYRALRRVADRRITDYDRIGRGPKSFINMSFIYMNSKYSGMAAHQPVLHTAFAERTISGAELERFSAGMEERLCRE